MSLSNPNKPVTEQRLSEFYDRIKPYMGGGGSGSSSTLADLTDTSISNPSGGQMLRYNSTTGKWENYDGERVYYPCTTDAGQGVKEVFVGNNVIKADGQILRVKFTNGNTNASPNIRLTYSGGNHGTNNIKVVDSDGTLSIPTKWWGAGDYVEFVYDSTNQVWLMQPTFSNFEGGSIYGVRYYSDTEERCIGKWLDDKPLYQKTVVIGSLVNGSYLHQCPNIDKIVDMETMAYDTQYDSAGSYIYGYNFYNVSATRQHIIIAGASGRSYFVCYVTLRYTKSTDVSGSFSSTETEVGTWIDGKTLYQKTFEIATLQNGTTAHNISNMGRCYSMDAIACLKTDTTDGSFITDSDNFVVKCNRTNITIQGCSVTGYKAYITLRYTKNS